MDTEEKVYKTLNDLQIHYHKHSHPPVNTVEEANQYWTEIEGAHCKNLFFRSKRGDKHYLVVLEFHKVLPIKQLNAVLGSEHLSFASAERLMKYLGLMPGSVSPFGLINDTENHVSVLLDNDLRMYDKLNFHPNRNTATLTISFTDFERFMQWSGNEYKYITIND